MYAKVYFFFTKANITKKKKGEKTCLMTTVAILLVRLVSKSRAFQGLA